MKGRNQRLLIAFISFNMQLLRKQFQSSLCQFIFWISLRAMQSWMIWATISCFKLCFFVQVTAIALNMGQYDRFSFMPATFFHTLNCRKRHSRHNPLLRVSCSYSRIALFRGRWNRSMKGTWTFPTKECFILALLFAHSTMTRCSSFIVMNELSLFICFQSFLWSSNAVYAFFQVSKFSRKIVFNRGAGQRLLNTEIS